MSIHSAFQKVSNFSLSNEQINTFLPLSIAGKLFLFVRPVERILEKMKKKHVKNVWKSSYIKKWHDKTSYKCVGISFEI